MTLKNHNRKYDLEERTAKFGEDIIIFCKKVPRNLITNPLITQLVKAGTSVGANYCEADDAESKKDFKWIFRSTRTPVSELFGQFEIVLFSLF